LYLFIGLLIFVALGALMLSLVAESQNVRVGERLHAVQKQSRVIVRGTTLDSELSKSLFQRMVVPSIASLRQRLLDLAPSQMVASVRERLDRAGNPSYLTVPTFITLKVICALGGVLGFFLVGLLLEGTLLMRLGIAGCVLAAGVMGVDYLLEGKIRTRQNKIRKSLPDIIDLLVVSTEAGTGLDGALAVVLKRKHGPLPDEFDRLLTEVRLGKSRQQAWQDMGERVGLTDLQMLIAALRQAEQLGVSIANTLRTQADALRTRRSIQIRRVAATLAVKMLFPLIFCILPAMFVVVLGPGLMSISGGFEALGW